MFNVFPAETEVVLVRPFITYRRPWVPQEQFQLCFDQGTIADIKSKEQLIYLEVIFNFTSRISFLLILILILRNALDIKCSTEEKKSMQNCFLIPVFSFFYYYLLGVIIFLTLHFKITFISVKWHVRGKLCMHCCINVRFLSLKMPAIKYSQYCKKVDLPCISACYIFHSNLYLVSKYILYNCNKTTNE